MRTKLSIVRNKQTLVSFETFSISSSIKSLRPSWKQCWESKIDVYPIHVHHFQHLLTAKADYLPFRSVSLFHMLFHMDWLARWQWLEIIFKFIRHFGTTSSVRIISQKYLLHHNDCYYSGIWWYIRTQQLWATFHHNHAVLWHMCIYKHHSNYHKVEIYSFLSKHDQPKSLRSKLLHFPNRLNAQISKTARLALRQHCWAY